MNDNYQLWQINRYGNALPSTPQQDDREDTRYLDWVEVELQKEDEE